MSNQDITQFLASEEDVEFEAEISRNPYRLKAWWRYLQAKKGASRKARNILHERALHFLPRSYKLWRQYLGERVAAVEGKAVTDTACQIVVNTYERALVHMHKMPRMWMDYCAFLGKLRRGTQTRRAFDRALQALSITQHHLLWPQYLSWVRDFGSLETAIRVYRRYLMLDGARREEYVEYLESAGLWEEAARQLANCVNDDAFVSPAGHSKHQMWMKLCDLCARHPEDVSGALKVDAIIRSGIGRFTDEVGRLWCKLGDYYIRLGQFERARDVYEEAINSVMTVRDFTMVFDAYTQFEESVLTAKMHLAEEEAAAAEEDGEEPDEEEDDVEMRLARLEHLMERRPLLVSSVLLRQNPHNVHEWQKRAKLLDAEPAEKARCFAQAVQAVDPQKAVGKLSRLWLEFAKFYAEQGDEATARELLERATLVPYRSVDELTDVYLAWADFEQERDDPEAALRVLQRAVTEPPASIARRRGAAALGKEEKRRAMADAPVQERVHRTVRVWDRYLALEAEVGTLATVRAAYDKAIESRVATPQMVLDYADYLESRKYFEDAFRAYERGVAAFEFPHARPVWMAYLDRFVGRYGGTKLERARDLFEQVLSKVPAAGAADFYVLYARFEEKHGLTKKQMAVYDRACGAVPPAERLKFFQVYANMVRRHYGDVQARKVYERAVQELPEDGAREMSAAFAALEEKLGEVDRARAVWTHGSQFADPRRHAGYWSKWHQFEVELGNQDTFREMLRVKRSVQMAFSNVNYMAAEMLSGDVPLTSDADALAADRRREEALRLGQTTGELGRKRKAAEGGAAETDMEALERQAERIRSAAAAAGGGESEDIDIGDSAAKTPAAGRDDGEIDIGDEGEIDIDGEGEEGAEAGGNDGLGEGLKLVQRAVPDAVFGGAKEALEREQREKEEQKQQQGKPLGALERLRAKGK